MSAPAMLPAPRNPRASCLHCSVLATPASASPIHRSTSSRADGSSSPEVLRHTLPAGAQAARAAPRSGRRPAPRPRRRRAPRMRRPPRARRGASPAPRARPARRARGASSRHRRGSMSVPASAASCTPKPGARSLSTYRTPSTAASARLRRRASTRARAPPRRSSRRSGCPASATETWMTCSSRGSIASRGRREPRAAHDGARDAVVDLAVDVERSAAETRRLGVERVGVGLGQTQRGDDAATARYSSASSEPSAARTARSTRTASQPYRFTRATSLSLGLLEKRLRIPRAPSSSVTFSRMTPSSVSTPAAPPGRGLAPSPRPGVETRGHARVRLPLQRRGVRRSAPLEDAVERVLRVSRAGAENEDGVLARGCLTRRPSAAEASAES